MKDNKKNNSQTNLIKKIAIVAGIVVLALILIFNLNSNKNNSENNSNSNSVTEITMTNFSFEPNEIKAKPGEKLEIKIKNNVGSHNFAIKDLDLKTDVLKSGEEQTINIEIPNESGKTYEYRSTFDNQDELGMVGKIIVE